MEEWRNVMMMSKEDRTAFGLVVQVVTVKLSRPMKSRR